MLGEELGNIKNEPACVNAMFLYVALEELRVLREFVLHDY